MAHDHDHAHPDDHSELGEMDLRVRALETVLTQKGYIDPAALDVLIDTYQTKIGPRNGARVVAKAWADPAFRDWLLKDATAAIASLGYTGRQGEHMLRWPTPTTSTTWWSAPCAVAIRGRCSACRPPGTRARPTARAPSGIRAACWPSSASNCPLRPASAYGTRPRKCAIS